MSEQMDELELAGMGPGSEDDGPLTPEELEKNLNTEG